MPRWPGVALTVVAVTATAGCGSTGPATRAATGPAAVNQIRVIRPFLPLPANPEVAAVYLTIADRGPVADDLVSVSSPAAGEVQLMAEDPMGASGTDPMGASGTDPLGASGTMAVLGRLAVPAHGQATLAPGHDHVMLERPTSALRIGEHVPVVLHFANAGPVAVEVPVVPLDSLIGG